MLQFFRKYQRILYSFVAFIIITSFSFFGVQRGIAQNPIQEVDTSLGAAYDGQEMSQQEIDRMRRFIETDQNDTYLLQIGEFPNALNDGFYAKDLLKSGIAKKLVSHCQSEVKDSLQSVLHAHSHYKPYVHPGAPFLSQVNLWNQFYPEMKKAYEEFQSVLGNKKQKLPIDELQALYLEQQKTSPELLRRFLLVQQQQNEWIQPDPRLNSVAMNVFNAKRLSDWFGESYTKLCAQFCYNSALAAKKMGMAISKSDLQSYIQEHAYKGYQFMQQFPQNPFHSPDEYLQALMGHLGLNEEQLYQTIETFLLSRRWIHSQLESVLDDSTLYAPYNQFAQEILTIDLYQLPEEFQLKDAEDWALFETYLSAIADPDSQEKPLCMPDQFFSLDEIAAKSPEIVHKKINLQMKELTRKELLDSIPLSEIIDWELDEKNFSLICNEFPNLGIQKAENDEIRYQALESLDKASRKQVDLFARKQIALSKPEKALDLLKNKKWQKQELSVSLDLQDGIPYGIDSAREFLQVVDSLKVGESKEVYTQDHFNYYAFQKLDDKQTKQVLGFADAKDSGGLKRLLKRKTSGLNQQKDTIALEDTSDWKDVSEEISLAKHLYKTRVHALEKHLGKEIVSVEELLKHRFDQYLEEVKTHLSSHEEVNSQDLHYSSQWQLKNEKQSISRQAPRFSWVEEAFAMNLKTPSPIKYLHNRPCFYLVDSREYSEEKNTHLDLQELLEREAGVKIIDCFIQELLESDCFHL